MLKIFIKILYLIKKKHLKIFKSSTLDVWLAQYLRGASMEMYTEYLSSSFSGKTFTQTAMYFVIFILLNI